MVHIRTHIMNGKSEREENEKKSIDNAAVIRCVQFYGVWFGLNIHNIKPANSRKQHKNAEKSTHRKVEKKDDNEYSRIRKMDQYENEPSKYVHTHARI